MAAPRIRLKFGHKLFLSHFLAVVLVSGSVGSFFYISAIDSLMQSLRSRLKNSAALLSQSIDARNLKAIRSETDVDMEVYKNTLATLRRLRRSNPDIAFLYIMRKESGQLFFVIDSDETERQAQPGQEYTDAPESMLKAFHDPSVDDKPYRDEWGVFLSGYSPLRNGEGEYLIGIDMRADEVDQKMARLQMTGLLSLFGSLLLALLFSLYFSRGLGMRIRELTSLCSKIAMGRLEARSRIRTYDEFDDLIEAFNTMGEELEQTRNTVQLTVKELSDSRDRLETRVKERTRELEAALDKVQVLSGFLPICCSCKKIRDDEGYWQQVEQFVQDHTNARFTHGFCPDCVTKLYGNILSNESGPKIK
jgi:methyl-accepting chemotaxis protein